MASLDDDIPDKLSFKIGETARLVGVEPHVLRFWETSFGRVRPQKGRNGHRLYSRADVRLLRRIRALLHDQRYTIAGARALLREGEEAVQAVLGGRPIEAASALDAATSEAGSLRAEIRGLQKALDDSERAARLAREEARFWKREARKATATLKALADGVRNEALALRDAVDTAERRP